jgi:WD40 repeat protein
MLLNTHAEQVLLAEFCPAGIVLATADSENAVHLWSDPLKGQTAFVLQGHTDEVRAMAFRRDGKRLATAGVDRVIHVWDVASGNLLSGRNAHTRYAVALSAAGRLASVSGTSSLQVWDLANGEAVPPSENAGFVQAIAFSPDGRVLATGGRETGVELWDATAGTKMPDVYGSRGPVTALAFSPDSKLIGASGPGDGTVWIWDIAARQPVLLIPEAVDGCTVEALAFHPEGKLLACGGIDWLATSGSDGAVCLWDVQDRSRVVGFDGGVSRLAFHPSGRWLAGASLQNTVTVWDVQDQQPIFVLEHPDQVTALAFSPDGNWLVTGGDDHTVRVWNVLSGRQVSARQLDTPVKALAFSADGQTLITGNGNTTCYQVEMKGLLEE